MAYTTINKSTNYFNTKLFTGTGSSNALTGVGFQPDWVWIKDRQDTHNHNLFDAVRGVTKRIYSDTTDAETTNAESLKSFDSDGFTLGTQTNVNQSGHTNVAWNWKANGAGSANSDGTVNSTVSANTTAGFSIVSWTHTTSGNYTVGHGLGSTPKMILAKSRNATYNWDIYHSGLTSGNRLSINSTAAQSSGYWGANDMNNNTFSISSDLGNNGTTMIGYIFAEKTGYSKFGSYTGNGSSDGAFCFTGFKPKFLLVKRTDTADWWGMFDNKREGYNPTNDPLFAQGNDVEGGPLNMDLLSNGFKWYTSNNGVNGSGGSYIYMAFGQSLVGSNNVPCTAR